MTPIGLNYFFCLTLACFFIQADAAHQTCFWDEDCFCQNTSINSIEEFLAQKDGIINHLWTVGLNGWSPLANLFKGELQNLRNTGSQQAVDFAELTILFMSTFNPFIDDFPSACAQAAMIQASISCVRDGEPGPILEQIQSGLIGSLYSFAVNFAHYGGLQSTMCPIDEDKEALAEVPTWECEGNGLVYDIETVWDLKGQNIPESTRNLVRQLYDSDNFRDRYIAVMATYSLLDFPNKIKNFFNPTTFFELLNLQYGPNYSLCCCEEREERLEYLANVVAEERTAALAQLEEFYSGPDACKNGNF